MSDKANTPIDIKLNNQKLIINCLIDNEPMTRAELAKRLQASKPTISKNVDSLISKKMVIELGKADNALGKKGTNITLNKAFCHILGVDLSKEAIRYALADLSANIKEERRLSYQDVHEGLDGLQDMLEVSGISDEDISQVVVAYPGVVSPKGEYISNHLLWDDKMQGLIHKLIKRFGSRVTVKNDINIALLAVKAYECTESSQNLYFMSFETGVGAGIIINGQLYEGDRNAAGEVGFTYPVQTSHENRLRTLEEIVSLSGILNRYRELTDEAIELNQLKVKLQSKEPIAERLYHEVIITIGISVSNAATILDIENIILSGRVLTLHPDMLNHIQEVINRYATFDICVKVSTIQNPALKGCIYLGIQKAIEEMI